MCSTLGFRSSLGSAVIFVAPSVEEAPSCCSLVLPTVDKLAINDNTVKTKKIKRGILVRLMTRHDGRKVLVVDILTVVISFTNLSVRQQWLYYIIASRLQKTKAQNRRRNRRVDETREKKDDFIYILGLGFSKATLTSHTTGYSREKMRLPTYSAIR